MTSRERVLRCLNHQTADRVPLDGLFRPEVWVKLKKHFGTEYEDLVSENLGLDFKSVDMTVPREFLERSGGAEVIRHDDGSYEDEWGLVIAPSNMVQFDVPMENLLAVYETVKEVGR